MKRILLILILTFSFQPLIKAEDISDFQIEGISIGDSALDYFTIKELNNSMDIHDYLDEYRYYFLSYSKAKEYEYLQITVKQNDKNFIIHDIQGHIFYDKNIKDCFKKMKDIKKDIDEVLNYNGIEDSGLYPWDYSGKSTYKRIKYDIKGGVADIVCFDMGKEMEIKGKYDRFAITLSKIEFLEWLYSNAEKIKKGS